MDKLRKKMFELAYQYKEAKLWDLLGDDQLFAVEHADKSISYCSVLGMLGQQFALNIYTEAEGIASYFRLLELAEMPGSQSGDPFLEGEIRNAQKCLSCSFEDKEYLSDAEVKEAMTYAKALGVRLRGKNMYALFLDYTPGCHPWKIESVSDMEHMCDALESAIALSEMLHQGMMNPFEIRSCRTTRKVLLFTKEKDRWVLNEATVLPMKRFAYPRPVLTNELILHKIKHMKKKEIMQCGMFYMPSMVGNPEGEERPYYPLVLLAVTEEPPIVCPIHLASDENPDIFLNAMAEHIVNDGHCPKVIRCADARCFNLLEDFCQKTGIILEKDGNLNAYEEAARDLYEQMSDPQGGPFNEEEAQAMMQAMLEDMNRMSDFELRQLPEGIIRSIKGIPNLNQLMPELYRRLKKLYPD